MYLVCTFTSCTTPGLPPHAMAWEALPTPQPPPHTQTTRNTLPCRRYLDLRCAAHLSKRLPRPGLGGTVSTLWGGRGPLPPLLLLALLLQQPVHALPACWRSAVSPQLGHEGITCRNLPPQPPPPYITSRYPLQHPTTPPSWMETTATAPPPLSPQPFSFPQLCSGTHPPVACPVEQARVGGQAITPRAPAFLVVALDALGNTPVHHQPHICVHNLNSKTCAWLHVHAASCLHMRVCSRGSGVCIAPVHHQPYIYTWKGEGGSPCVIGGRLEAAAQYPALK